MNDRRRRPAGDDAMVELDGIHLTLASAAGPVNILRGVDLAVRRGERVGIVGPSGSGKSTLLMVMAGLERPNAGSVLVNGVDFGSLGEDGLARFRRDTVGIVFQSFHLVPTMTAVENVAIPLELAGAHDAFSRAHDLLGAVGLADRALHYPSQLSGGEQQRVALARAFVAKPGLLLADEPTGNLDQATGSAVIELMFALQERHGSTLILISHDPALVRRCDRIAHLRDGRIERIEDGQRSDKPSTVAG